MLISKVDIVPFSRYDFFLDFLHTCPPVSNIDLVIYFTTPPWKILSVARCFVGFLAWTFCFQISTQYFNGIQIRALARPVQIPAFLSHSMMALAVCFRWLSCCQINFQFDYNLQTMAIQSSLLLSYDTEFLVDLVTASSPGPEALKQPKP